jgi:hypothetical protein
MDIQPVPPPSILRCILTDVQFWVPAVVLLAGVGLLIFIHGN